MPVEITKPVGVLRDVNGDGRFTISDVGGWLVQAFFLPGDWLIWATIVYATPVARFLELDSGDYGGVLSGAVSGLVWLALVMCALIVYRSVRNVDRVLTDSLGRGYAEGRRRLRIGIATRRARRRRRREAEHANARQETLEFAEEADVSDAELRVLELHAQLEPGFALGVGDVAVGLGIGRRQAADMCEKLAQLGFLGTTVGGADDEIAHTLTRAGRGFLSFRRLR